MNGPGKRGNVDPGPALDTPDEELDLMALPTIADIEAAKSDMATRGSRRLRALLEAARVEVATDAADVAAPFVPSD